MPWQWFRLCLFLSFLQFPDLYSFMKWRFHSNQSNYSFFHQKHLWYTVLNPGIIFHDLSIKVSTELMIRKYLLMKIFCLLLFQMNNLLCTILVHTVKYTRTNEHSFSYIKFFTISAWLNLAKIFRATIPVG